MNISSVIKVLLIISLFLLIPFFKPADEYDLFPFEKKSIIVNIHGTKATISSNIITPIQMNVSYLNPQNDNLESIFNSTIISDYELELDSRGHYKFDFLTPQICKISIKISGIPVTTILFISVLILILMVIRAKRWYTESVI